MTTNGALRNRVLLGVIVGAGVLGTAWLGRPGQAVAASKNSAREQIRLPEGMKTYPSPYYTIYTDLPQDDVKEISIRMTRMAEEYHSRTSGFSGTIRSQLPFYVFSKPEDYYLAGGAPGSAGVFMSRGPANAADSESRLMAIAIDHVLAEKKKEAQTPTPTAKGKGKAKPKPADDDGKNTKDSSEGSYTWHVIQHEGFHQFAHAVIGGDLPMWVNEGLAEYFGESIFTGDGFVTGIIPPNRLMGLKAKITAKRLKSMKQMMLTSNAQWNAEMNIDNYDMAWSMVHFLAHGEDGKYQKAFSSFMTDISHRRSWQTAWEANFGSADGFEKHWSQWWLAQIDDPTADLYARATVSTYTSFAARAFAQKQKFDNFDEFSGKAKSHELKVSASDWLPVGILDLAMRAQKRDATTRFSLENDAAGVPRIVATLSDKTRIVGSFTPSGSRTGKISVDQDDMIPVMEKARTLAAANKKDQARDLLRPAIARHPKSPVIEQARQLMAELAKK